jgi:hypothetical protein
VLRERLGLPPVGRVRKSWFSRAVSDVVDFLRWGYVDFMQYGIVEIVRDIRDIIKPPPLREPKPPHSALFGFRLASDP